jgi:hypothetical protein
MCVVAIVGVALSYLAFAFVQVQGQAEPVLKVEVDDMDVAIVEALPHVGVRSTVCSHNKNTHE